MAFCVVPLISTCFGQAAPASQLQALYESHQWFSLRKATEHTKAPLFYRSAVEAAFNRIGPAQKHLDAVIQAAPHSPDAYKAHELLASLYFRNGLYSKAFTQIDAMLAEKPAAEDVKNMRPLFSALSQSNQIVLRKKASTLQMRMEDGNLYLPLAVAGKEANYVFDSGANFSIMSESEAKRLSLAVRNVDTKLGDSSGAHLGVRVAVAKDVTIGGLHLKNVAFGVLPDTQEPFAELPEGKRGILGIPVLLAMQTLRWEPNGTFAFGFNPKHTDLSTSNLSFEESFPVTQVFFQGKSLDFTLDTGATHTVLSPPFAMEFPALLKSSGQKESHKLTGVGGSSSYDSVLLPAVTLQVGGHNVSLEPAHVLVKQSSDTSSWAAGNLGMDLLNQAHAIILDFHGMMLSLE
jgi:predicted aspartyl protease